MIYLTNLIFTTGFVGTGSARPLITHQFYRRVQHAPTSIQHYVYSNLKVYWVYQSKYDAQTGRIIIRPNHAFKIMPLTSFLLTSFLGLYYHWQHQATPELIGKDIIKLIRHDIGGGRDDERHVRPISELMGDVSAVS